MGQRYPFKDSTILEFNVVIYLLVRAIVNLLNFLDKAVGTFNQFHEMGENLVVVHGPHQLIGDIAYFLKAAIENENSTFQIDDDNAVSGRLQGSLQYGSHPGRMLPGDLKRCRFSFELADTHGQFIVGWLLGKRGQFIVGWLLDAHCLFFVGWLISHVITP